MLRVSLIGHLGADAEARSSQRGASLVSFRVAVNLVRTTPDGSRQESTEWFTVRVMGGQADFASRLGRGARVLVVGRLGISHYQSREGEPRTGFDVWADEIQSLSPRANGEPVAPTDRVPQTRPGQRPTAAGRQATRPPVEDDEIPF
jgi:single stranded DNA-binding protein